MADEKKTKYEILEDSINELKAEIAALKETPISENITESVDLDKVVKESVVSELSGILQRLERIEKQFDAQLNKGIPVSKFVGDENMATIMRTGDVLTDEKGKPLPRPIVKNNVDQVINLP